MGERPQESETALSKPTGSLSRDQRDIVAGVRKYGWTALSVGDDRREPVPAYTIGFWLTLGHAELVVHGMPNEVANDVLWAAFRMAKERGPLPVGEPLEGIWNDPVYLMPMAEAEKLELMLGCGFFYDRDDFPALQIVWTDEEGRFPWDDDFAKLYRGIQTDYSGVGWRSILGLGPEPEPEPEPEPPPRRGLMDRLFGRK